MADDETTRSTEVAEKAVAAFMAAAGRGNDAKTCAGAALATHTMAAGLEGGLGGDGEVQVWHLLCSLANHSDRCGFFRDLVFGPPAAGGPKLHKLVSAVRDLCSERGHDFDRIYGEVRTHIESEGPATPGI